MKKNKTETSSLKPGSLRYVWSRLLKNKSAVFGLTVIALLMILSLLSPIICRYDYQSMDALHTYATPSAEHLLGTDDLGRDILSRVLYGARYTFIIGVLSTAIAAVLGIAMGAVAGYFGGTVDSILMRFLDIFQSFPMLVLAMAFCAVFGTGIDKCILALGITNISGFARLMRANILRIRNMEYVEAATSIGCPTRKIITGHVIPNAISPIIVEIAMGISRNGLASSSLSFLGLGIKYPLASWGSIINAASNIYVMTNFWYIWIPAGILIVLTVLGFNFVGDGLRDAFDPKMKR
mgnify:CR=1 FL=1